MEKTVVERCHTNICNEVKKAIRRFYEKELREKLEEYYFASLASKRDLDDEYIIAYSAHFRQYLNEINHPKLEIYLGYMLSYHPEDFEHFLEKVYQVCKATNQYLKQMCEDPSSIQEKEMLKHVLKQYGSPFQNDGLNCVFEGVLSLEMEHLLSCYEKAVKRETFCETCCSCCTIKEDHNQKRKKRRVPNRV